MSEVVGNVSIELSIDRRQYDASIETLKKEKLPSLVVKTTLDTTGISKQLEAFKVVSDVRLGVALDTRAASRQMDAFLQPRSIKVGIDLDTTAINTKLERLSIADLKVNATLDTTKLRQSLQAFSTISDLKVGIQVDSASADRQINQIIRPRSIAVRVNVDDSGLGSIKNPSLKLKPVVDDSALTKLNEHLSLKERHFKQVQDLFSGSPLTPAVDDRGLSDLNNSIDRASDKLRAFNSIVRDSSASINLSSTIKIDTEGLRSAFKYGADALEKSTDKFIKDLVSTINKGSFSFGGKAGGGREGIAGGAIGSIFSGIAFEVTKPLSQGISKSFEQAISKSFGSSDLLGQMIGQKITGAIGSATSKAAPILESLKQSAGKIENKKDRKTALDIIETVQQAPQQIKKSLTSEVGDRAVERDRLSSRYKNRAKNEATDRLAQTEADIEFKDLAPKVAKQNKISETAITAANQRILKATEEFTRAKSILAQLQGELNSFVPKQYDKTELAFAEMTGEKLPALPSPKAQLKPLQDKVATAKQLVMSTGQNLALEKSEKAFIEKGRDYGNDRLAVVNSFKSPTPTYRGKDLEKYQQRTIEEFRIAEEDRSRISLSAPLRKKQIQDQVPAARQEFNTESLATVRSNRRFESAVKRSDSIKSALEQKIKDESSAENPDEPVIESLKARLLKSSQRSAAIVQSRSSVAVSSSNRLSITKSKIDKLSSAMAAIDAAVAEAESNYYQTFDKFREAFDQKGQPSKEYIELAKIVMGKQFSEKNLPKLQVMTAEEEKRTKAVADYLPVTNTIRVNRAIGAEVNSGKVLGKYSSEVLGEELGHAVDADFGSVEGVKRFKSGQVFGKAAKPTAAEYAQIAPDLGRYGSEVREVELSGKTRALRGSATYQQSRGLVNRQTQNSEELTAIASAESTIANSKNKIQSLAGLSNKFGLDLSKTIDILSTRIQEAESKVALLKQQSLKSATDLNAQPIDRNQLGDVAQNLGIIQGGIQRKLEPLQQLQIARSTELPNLQDSKYEASVLSVANKSLKKSGLTNSSEAVKEVSAEIKAIESQSKALALKISKLTPETAAKEYPEISKQAELLAARKAQVSQATAMIRGDVEASSPGVYDRSKASVDKQLERKEKVIQAAQLAKKGAGKVKDAVFNPDREIAIDMDKVKSGVQATGKALYGGGLTIAKAMDAINVGFNALAQSNPGQRVLGATKEASTALLHVAKTSYGLAKSVEDAALSIVPFGKTAKSGLQNIGLPMLAANVAASHIPGGQILLEGAGNVANMALGPLAHGGVSAMAQGVGSSIGGVFPQFGGMGAQVASGISGLIEGGLGGAITPAIETAVNLITGKLVMNAMGVGAMKLPGVAEIAGVKAIAPSSSKSPQLPASATKSLPQSAVEVGQSGPQLTDLTDRQLRAYAKTKGLAFGPKARKDDVVTRLQGTTGDHEGMVTSIQAQFDRKGRAIGVDAKAESAMLAKLKQKENELNQLHTLARKSQGQKRAEIVSQLLHETDVFTRELNSLNRTPMSGPTAQKVGQTLGRIESKYRHAPENTEAKLNNSETIKASLSGPVYGQTIEAQSQRLYRVADEKQLNIFQKLRNLLSKRSSAVAELNFKALYAEIAMSNKLTDIDNVPALAIGKENSYDPNSNTVSVTKRAYRELSKPIGKLRANEIKPVTHEIQHSQQLDGGNRSIAEAAYGSSDYRFGLIDKPLPKRVQRQVDASVAKGGNPQNADAVRKLEVDAYNKESQTKEFLNNLKPAASQKMPLNAIGLKLTALYGGLSDHVGHAIDSIKGFITGDKSGANVARTMRYNATATRVSSQRFANNANIADGAFDEMNGRSMKSEDGAIKQLFKKSKRSMFEMAKGPNGFAVEGEMRAVDLDSTQYESPASKYVAKLQKAIKGINGDISNKLNKQISNVTLDAKSLITDVEVSRIQAVQSGDTAQAKKLGSFKTRIEDAVTKSDGITSKDKRSGADNDALKGLRKEYKEIYAIADRPLPFNIDGGFTEKVGLASKSIKSLALGLVALPFAFQAIGFLKQFAGQAIQASIAADRMKTSLEFSTGSKSDASKAFEFADSTANKLGIDRKSTIEGYTKLRAASKGKLSEDQTNELFAGVGAASTKLGLSADDQNGVFLALGQMMSKGTVQAEELRGQIGERLPGAFAIAARSMGATEQQLAKMMETGSVVSDQFLPKLGQQLKREFGGGAEAASQNLQSSLFRMQGAIDRISEGAGNAAAPGMKIFTDVFVGGLDLVAKYGQQVSQVFTMLMGGALIRLGSLAIATIGPMITSLLAYNGIAATVPGVLGAIGSSLSGLIPIVGVFVAKFFLINAGIEIAKTLFSAFTPSDMASRFTTQADKINKSLKEVEQNGKNAQSAMPGGDSDAPSKGIDFNAMTFGLAGAVGMGKGDDLGKSIKKTSWLETALRYVPVIGDGIRTNEANGGKGIATMQEVKFNQDKVALNNDLGDAVGSLTGRYYDKRGDFSKSLETAQAEQKAVDAKQAEKSRLLSAGGNNKDAIALVDKQITESAAKRDAAGKDFSVYRDQIQSSITELKNQKDSISKSADYSNDQKKDLVNSVDGQLTSLETVKRQLDSLDQRFNNSGDIISKFGVALSEMAAKIEEASAKAENAFNKSEVGRLQEKNSNRQTDEFASTNSSERQAVNERTMAAQKLSGTQTAIASVDKMMADPTVKADLAKISVNGRSVDGETSAYELEQAKAGKSDGEKSRIDKLIARRKAIDSVPGLQKSQLEADEKQKEAKSANAIEKMDRGFKTREVGFKEFEGKANVGLINAQKGNKIDESDVAIRGAEIQNISAKEQQSVAKDKIAALKKMFDKGLVSKEEFVKRSIDLRGQLVDANTKAAQAELAVEQAKNRKILQDYELTIKKRELADKSIRSSALIALAKGQSKNRMSDDDVNISKSQIDLDSANRGAANIQTQLQELESLKSRGVITHEDYVKRKLDLDSSYLDAKVRQADAELAIEQAKNRKIVNDFDRAQQMKSFKLDQLQGNTENEIKRQALSGKIFGYGGEKEVREQRIDTSKSKLAAIVEKDRGIDKLRQDGTISEKDYESRKMESTNAYRIENENLLNLEIAKRLALYQAESDAFKRTNNEIIRGLDKQRSAYELSKSTMAAQQGLMDAELGYAKARQSNQELKLGLQGENLMDANGNVANMGAENPLTKKGFSKIADQLKIDSLMNIQGIELKILDIKEKQQRASLRQLEIEATIAVTKQKIALNESKKKLKDAKLTGDVDAIANAQDDVVGQTQILGLENEKMIALKEQNKLAEERLGIERKTAEIGMENERIKVRADQARNQRAASTSQQLQGGQSNASGGTKVDDGVYRNVDPFTGNMIIGGGSFITGAGIKPNQLGGVNPANLGSAANEVAINSRVDPKKPNVTVNSFEASNEKSSGKIVGAIEKLGTQLKDNSKSSGEKTVASDYSSIVNGLVDSGNSRN